MNMRLTCLAAALCAAAITMPAAAKEFRSSDVHPDDYPTVMAVKYMSDIIKQKTGGKDSIKVYTMSQLGSEKDTIEQTKIGALDFVRINVAPMNNICPETMVPTMPFLFRSKEHMRRCWTARSATRSSRRARSRASSGSRSTTPARARCTRRRSRSSRSPTSRG